MQTLHSKTILVVGLGESGLAIATWLTSQGAQVRITDTRSNPPQLAQLKVQIPNVGFFGGELAIQALEGIDQIVLSPGLSPYHTPLKEFLAHTATLNIPVIGEIDLFIQALDQLAQTHDYYPKILAITGTNGKTTTTMLTKHLLNAANITACVAGNVSPSMLDALMTQENLAELPAVWVLELSSFQLDNAKNWRADAATILNITEDHLDWHENISAYIAAKNKIFSSNAIQILNRDDNAVNSLQNSLQKNVLFGVSTPTRGGDFGLHTQDGLVWLVEAIDDNHEYKQRRKDQPLPLRLNLLMPINALQIKGFHNATNAMAALALCQAIGVPLATLLHGLRTYKGEPHRMEFVASIKEIDFVDDSKGTNVGATVAAMSGLNQKIILIAGGDGKGQNFSPLIEPASKHARAVCLIGKDAPTLKQLFDEAAIKAEIFPDLPSATKAAYDFAQAGDMVLLSPACASLDMFRNYKHRAEVFIETVRDIALDAGQPC